MGAFNLSGLWRHTRWYAQHGEDRRLASLLRGRRRGFYIDVGAWEPDQDSVTKHFYERGWHGVNIEPHPEIFARLAAARPRDINLRVALGADRSRRALTLVGTTGLATFDRNAAEAAQRWACARAEPRFAPAVTVDVDVTTLADVCRAHVPADVPIDFLKVDVEGWEAEVLRGGDWDAYRPTILVIEAVKPLTSEPAWQSWEPFIVAQRYDLIDFDGFNRWYRARSVTNRG